MSSYTPPPPPPGGGLPPNGPNFSRQAWKMQRRAMKAQARAQRAQWKMQRRAMRRRSIVGPLVLLVAGLVFLLAQMGRVSWAGVVFWYARWWPMVLIAAGLVLVAEWALDHARVDGQGRVLGTRTLGGGVIFLLILLAVIGSSLRFTGRSMEWKDHYFGPGWLGLQQVMGDEHDADDTASSALGGATTLVIHNPHGDVTVNGSSEDGQVHVSVHKQVWAWKESDATSRQEQLQPQFSNDGNSLVLTVAGIASGQADLTVQVPHTMAVTLTADHGNVSVNDIQGAVTVSSNHGNVDLNGIDGGVIAHINDDDSDVSADKIKGGVSIEGRAQNINLSDISGPVTLQGDFFGTTDVQRVNGAVRFESSRTQFQAERLDGEFEVAGGAELQASGLVGPVVLSTRNHNVTLDRVSGSVVVKNKNGSVDVTEAAPLSALEITNEHGSVDVGLPEGHGFSLDASTRHGEMENDFALTAEGSS
ncbi:MAG: DUF5668 domain-containing protein, partial [Acidobacteriota bacterium]